MIAAVDAPRTSRSRSLAPRAPICGVGVVVVGGPINVRMALS